MRLAFCSKRVYNNIIPYWDLSSRRKYLAAFKGKEKERSFHG